MAEYRRILLDGYLTVVTRDGDRLLAGDGRSIAVEDAHHLPPIEPRKIICVHLNYMSRVDEFMTKLPATPTYFHKPVSSLCGHRARVVRPERCRWLNYEGEVAIVIGRHCRNVARDEAGELAEQADLRSAPYFLGNGAGRFGIASPVACP